MDKQYFCKTCGKEISAFENQFKNGRCFNCAEKSYYDRVAEELQSDEETETYGEDKIICPYCGYDMEDDDGYFTSEQSGECECPECGKTFHFEAEISVTFSTRRYE